jgi:hypothetical protein
LQIIPIGRATESFLEHTKFSGKAVHVGTANEMTEMPVRAFEASALDFAKPFKFWDILMKSEPKMNSLNADDASERVVASGISVKKSRIGINERRGNIGILLDVVKTLLSLGSFKKAMDYVCFELNCGLKMKTRNGAILLLPKVVLPTKCPKGQVHFLQSFKLSHFWNFVNNNFGGWRNTPSPQSFHPLDRPFASFICSFIGDNYRINRVGGAHKSTSSSPKLPSILIPKSGVKSTFHILLNCEWTLGRICEDFDRRDLLFKEEEFGHL